MAPTVPNILTLYSQTKLAERNTAGGTHLHTPLMYYAISFGTKLGASHQLPPKSVVNEWVGSSEGHLADFLSSARVTTACATSCMAIVWLNESVRTSCELDELTIFPWDHCYNMCVCHLTGPGPKAAALKGCVLMPVLCTKCHWWQCSDSNTPHSSYSWAHVLQDDPRQP